MDRLSEPKFCTRIAQLMECVEVDPDTDCWNWTRFLLKSGYATVCVDGKKQCAHRLFYEFWVGKIPTRLVIDHLCRNRKCCNPDHLQPVPQEVNLERGIQRPLATWHVNIGKTKCNYGHRLDDANTYVTKNGYRQCRQCNTRRLRETRARKREKR